MKENKILTITEVSSYLKTKLDSDDILSNVKLEGEISNLVNHRSGHMYFSLKDDFSTISAVMFSSANSKLNFVPKNGDKVIVSGKISVYIESGRYQIYVSKMEEKGDGSIYYELEALKKKLYLEGMFDETKKLPLPKFPRHIGLITSMKTAAYEDFINTLNNRYPYVTIHVYESLVQGNEASRNLIRQIENANLNPLLDVICMIRGGGSIEDLWCFNDEALARAVFNSKIPIITGVGHEIDYTLVDFVSSKRSVTPTAAAVDATPSKSELLNYLGELDKRLSFSIESKIKNYDNYLKMLDESYLLKDGSLIIERFKTKLALIDHKLASLTPANLLKEKELVLDNLVDNLNHNYQLILDKNINKLDLLMKDIMLNNPLQIMSKGYSLTYSNGKLVTSSNSLAIGDILETKFDKGRVLSKVVEVENGK